MKDSGAMHSLTKRCTQDLKDHMRRSGDVEYVKILEDYNGKSRVSSMMVQAVPV